jgi:IS1 family transposase
MQCMPVSIDSVLTPKHITDMNRLSVAARAQIIQSLVEGNSVRSTCRMVGVAKGTVLKLLVEAGEAATIYQHETLVNLPCKRVQFDEIWAFVGAKAKNVKNAKRPTEGMGDIWTWTALCADTKLTISWQVGGRDMVACRAIVSDVAGRMAGRVQITTDGYRLYGAAIEQFFGWNGCDYGKLEKIYQFTPQGNRYSPPECIGAKRIPVMGNPDENHISTSFVERSNLTIRMQSRRFTRLTNGFSKKAENHAAAVALHCLWYNFCRPHATLTKAAGGIHTTPAMSAGVSDRVWSPEDVVHIIDRYAK